VNEDVDWISVQSSFIQEVALCEQSRVIAFRMGEEEIFFEISNPRVNIKSLFNSFLNSDSKGQFFNKVFRSNKRLT